jgi:6-phosphogluconolactonase
MEVVMRRAVLWVCGLAVGCGNVSETPDAAVDAPATPMFTVGGTVTGLAGSGLVVKLNGGPDLPIAADGTFMLPGTLASGATYTVTIGGQPTCPQRRCMVGNATGTVSGANVTNITVTCALPRFRLASLNWGTPQGIRITDDILALANNATATPRIVTGASTTLGNSDTDSVAFDGQRGLIYAAAQTTVPDLAVLVFANAATTSGNIAPARRFTIAAETSFEGVEIDEVADRLYIAGGSGKLYVLNSASTLSGAVTPTATITLASPGAITRDPRTDRLYIASQAGSMYAFDGARQLTAVSTPSRTMTWSTPADSARSVALDPCRNRLYLGFRNVSNGVNIFVFDNAATLTGAVDLQAASQARLAVPGAQVMSSALDSVGTLYFWKDSATAVNIVTAPHSLSGTVTVTPDKVINAVVDRGYGLDVVSY